MKQATFILALTFQFFVGIHCKFVLTLENAQINIKSLNKCNGNANYFVTVDNIDVKNENSTYLISGTLSTKIDLNSPLKADLKVERKEIGIWMPVPCIDNIGSCTYSDLCVHGIPKNDSCPAQFLKNDVPCRCPIAKGVYTLKQFHQSVEGLGNVLSGYYYAKIVIKYKNIDLSCYEVYFELEENLDDGSRNMLPFVEIV